MVKLNPINDEQQILKEVQEVQRQQETFRSQASKSEKPIIVKPDANLSKDPEKRERRFLERSPYISDDGVILKHRLPLLSYLLAIFYLVLMAFFIFRFVKYNQYYSDVLSFIDKVGLSATFNVSFVSTAGALICFLMAYSILSAKNAFRKLAIVIEFIVFGLEAYLAISSFNDFTPAVVAVYNPILRVLFYIIFTPYIYMFVPPMFTVFFLENKNVKRYYI